MLEWWIYSEVCGFSSCLASFVLYDGGIDSILNIGHWLVMVNICRSSQKRFRYDCIFCKNIQ